MKRYWKAAIVLAVGIPQWATIGCAPQAELMDAQRLCAIKSVAVLPFEDAPGRQSKQSGTATCGFITGELSRCNRFRIVERSRLTAIMDEQQLQTADVVDTAAAVKLGKMLGVQAVFIGSVSQYDMDKTTVYIYVVPVVSRSYKVGATVRLIDVSNGEVIYAHSACGSSGSNFTEAGKQAAKLLLAPLLAAQAPPA